VAKNQWYRATILAGIIWLVGNFCSTVVESDEQVLVGMPDDGHMALYEVCFSNSC